MLVPAYASPRRGASKRTRPFGEFDACDGGWDIEGEPFTRAPGTQFSWWRGRMLGGRTNHWGRISLRFGPDDFKGKSKDGLGEDWPISYDDIKPYYDRVDDLIGVFGSNEGLRNHPDGHLPARAAPALLRAAREEDERQARHHLHSGAALDHHEGDQRATGLPLLRPVQSRLPGEGELLEPRRAHRPRAQDGQAHAAHQRDGARSHRRQGRPRDRRHLRRQEVGHRQARQREDRRARRERVRVGAAAAQLEVVAVSAGTRQLHRLGGQGTHRHHRHRRRRIHSGDGRSRAAQRRRRGRHARVHALVARQQEARLPARLPHRSVGRTRRTGLRLHGRHLELSRRRRLRQVAQGRLSQVLRRDDRLLRPRRA